MQYQIKTQKPKLYWLVRLFFPDYDFNRHIFTFYRTIYIKGSITEASLAHEMEHIRQQGGSVLSAILHAICYRLSSKYRYQSEIEAYRAEYHAFAFHERNQDRANVYAKKLAGYMLQPLYGFEPTGENFYKIIKDIKR